MLAGLSAGLLASGCAAGPPPIDAVSVEAGEYPGPARPVRSPLAPAVVSDAALERAGEARRVAELLRLVPGQRVAQLEAGTGYYALRFARALGPASSVIAADTDPGEVLGVEQRAQELDAPWVRGVQSTPDDPRLPPGAVDLALVADAYATIAEPYAYFARLVPAIAGGGRLAVVALDADIRLGGVPLAVLECELGAIGYRLETQYRLVPADRYLAVFTPPERPVPAAAMRPCGSDGSPVAGPR